MRTAANAFVIALATAATSARAADDTIYVVQAKSFLAEGRFDLVPQLTHSIGDSFTTHAGVVVAGAYHVRENVALEATVGAFGAWDQGGPRFGGSDTELTTELRNKEGVEPERVEYYQFPWLISADAHWSPVYGKVNIHDVALGQFELYLSVGGGVVGLALPARAQLASGATNYVELPLSLGVLPPLAPATSFGGGLRIQLADWIGVRFEVRDYVIPLAATNAHDPEIGATEATFDVSNFLLAQLGTVFRF